MKVGFLVVSQGGKVEFQLFDHGCTGQPTLVKFSQAFDYSAVLIGRLYYRRDLLVDLASRLSEQLFKECEADDAALALAMYHHLGLNGLERLEGDFALIIWDAKENRLLASRDPMGGYPLFWTECNERIALSTSLRSLLNLLPNQSLNLEYLADFLMAPGPVNERIGEQCVYEGINRLSAGTIMSIHVPTRCIDKYAYWNWLERIVDPDSERVEEVGERYADLLRHAVRERIHGLTASHLSGGMDSTAVSLIARDWILSGVGKAPLHTLSLVYNQLPGLARETPYLESVLQEQKDNIAIHRIPADELLDFDSFTDPPFHDEPYVGLWRLGMDRATVNAAASFGAATMLTGIGADEMLDTQPFHITELLQRGRLHLAWTEACKYAQADNCSPWRILYPFGITNLLPAWMRSGLGQSFLGQNRLSLKNQNDWAIPPWIVPSFARQYALRSQAIKNAHQTYHSHQSTGLSFALFSIESRIGDVIRWSVAAPLGIVIAHPFLDVRLLCLGLGIQMRLKPEPGRMKPILAEATRGLLPDTIRNRRRKGYFNEIYYLGLARNLQSLKEMIQRAPIDDLGMLDKDTLTQYLHPAALGGAHVRSLHRLNLTLSLIKWLSMQSGWRHVDNSPTQIIRVGRQGRINEV
jgi:asparagine synthase (glutamine-hydrolysing)